MEWCNFWYRNTFCTNVFSLERYEWVQASYETKIVSVCIPPLQRSGFEKPEKTNQRRACINKSGSFSQDWSVFKKIPLIVSKWSKVCKSVWKITKNVFLQKPYLKYWTYRFSSGANQIALFCKNDGRKISNPQKLYISSHKPITCKKWSVFGCYISRKMLRKKW